MQRLRGQTLQSHPRARARGVADDSAASGSRRPVALVSWRDRATGTTRAWTHVCPGGGTGAEEGLTEYGTGRNALILYTGGVGAEPRVPGTSWTALTLEVGKSPTEVTCGRHVPRSPPSAIIEFASSPSCSWSLNRAVRETGANMVSKTQERALETPDHPL